LTKIIHQQKVLTDQTIDEFEKATALKEMAITLYEQMKAGTLPDQHIRLIPDDFIPGFTSKIIR
jgi:hypothetical protein